jgi:hypothetical protein
MRTFSEYKETLDAAGNEYDPRQSTGMLGNFQNALQKISAAQKKLQDVIQRRAYSENEIKEIRGLLLNAVRNDLDASMGHMPDKRHY